MSASGFGFYFEAAGRAAAQGAIAPAEQFFEGSLAEESLARETGQNSIDARAGSGPVVMDFELRTVATASIPGIDDLRRNMEQVVQATQGSQGHERMVRALAAARQDTIDVLRVGDYGTNGLLGSESRDAPQSPLSALTRGAGISANDGSRGGSFGIGSAVGPMASDMCTVLYSSLPQGGSDVVFAGYSRLASHRDDEGTWRMGDGFFTDLAVLDDFRYLRNPSALQPFALRTEPGTDVFVLAYRKAGDDPDLQHIREAFLHNFLLAIHRGHLIVRGRSATTSWQLDQDSLAHHVQAVPEAQAFYRAIHDPSPIEKDSRRFGRLRLFINVDDTLEKTLHTAAVRKPLMKIHTFRHTSIPAKYAAVLECSDDAGNTYLRQLEPPQHHQWDPGRATDGAAAMSELQTFVRQGLRSRVKEQIGDQVEIKGLERYLPAQVFEEGTGAGGGGRPTDGDGSNVESSAVHGAEGASRPAFNRGRKSVRVGVRTAADSDGDRPTTKGKDRGGKNGRKSEGGSLPGSGAPGDGRARIHAGDVRFRSWTDSGSGELVVALTPAQDIAGELELVALGPGGILEDDYLLPIQAVTLSTNGRTDHLSFEGNVLAGVQLASGVTSQLRLKLLSAHRYRLGVK